MSLENRTSLLERVVRYELPIEDTLVLLRAYGWEAPGELVQLAVADAVAILERYLAGELTGRQVQHWAELLELRKDVGYAPPQADELRRLIFALANPEASESLSPSLARRLRRLLRGEET